jgi:putative acetyltransferase
MIIRHETESDIDAIFEVTKAAFEHHPISQHTEQYIVNALRAAHALAVSLVADVDGRVVGHIAFSPLALSDGSCDWYGVGPLSVLPACQKQGIGKSLVREGLSLLKARGAQGFVLVGDPNYYERFGFKSYPGLTHEGVPQQYVLALPRVGTVPRGAAIFHQGFWAKG